MNGDAEIPYGLTLSAISSFLLVLLTLVLASFMIWMQSTAPGGADWIFQYGMPLFLSLGSISHFAPRFLWMREVRFCEAGVLWDQQVLEWDRLIEYQWKGRGEQKLQLFGVDSPRDVPMVSIPVTRSNRIIAQEILDSRRKLIDPANKLRVGVGQVPVTEFLTTSHLRRHTPAILASLVCGGALILLGLFREAGIAEFDQAKLVGIYLWASLSAVWQWRRRNAGGAIMRIFARRDWLGFVVTMLLALGIYEAASHMILQWGWLYFVAGLAFVYLAMRTVSYFFITQLDLREKGIVMFGGFYWPWPTIRLVSWDPRRSGRLVLARGLRRVIGTVMPEQRETVSRVLREKLGYESCLPVSDHIAVATPS
jgi:hypothetical protein